MGSSLLKRRWSVAILLACLTTVGVVGSVSSWWAHRVLFDTDTWMETVAPIGTSEVVTGALSDRFSSELIDWIDAENRLESLLPPILGPLAGYGARFINGAILDETDRFFASEFYANAWFRVNETAHRAAVAVIRDEVPNASTEGGVVTVDLVPILTPIIDSAFARVNEFGEAVPLVILNQVNIDETIGEIIDTYESEGLPDRLSNIVVYSSDRLAVVQSTTAILDRLVWVLPFLSILFAVGAMYFAPVRIKMAWGLLGGAALGWLAAWLAVTLIVHSIVDSIEKGTAATVAQELFTGVTSGLTTLLTVLAIVTGLGAVGVLVWDVYMSRMESGDGSTT